MPSCPECEQENLGGTIFCDHCGCDPMLRRYDIVDPKRLRAIGEQVAASFGRQETGSVQ